SGSCSPARSWIVAPEPIFHSSSVRGTLGASRTQRGQSGNIHEAVSVSLLLGAGDALAIFFGRMRLLPLSRANSLFAHVVGHLHYSPRSRPDFRSFRSGCAGRDELRIFVAGFSAPPQTR